MSTHKNLDANSNAMRSTFGGVNDDNHNVPNWNPMDVEDAQTSTIGFGRVIGRNRNGQSPKETGPKDVFKISTDSNILHGKLVSPDIGSSNSFNTSELMVNHNEGSMGTILINESSTNSMIGQKKRKWKRWAWEGGLRVQGMLGESCLEKKCNGYMLVVDH
ncbi:hypothetical protein QYF36_020459 [Acer negundo]|nr:hypothetical protein QYF36_020459 [Acer negundo]